MCFKKLPKWIIPTTSPAFNDVESGTATEMVGRIYEKMNELVEKYNQFIDDVNNSNKTFTEEFTTEYEKFGVGLRQEFQDFIDTVNLEYDHFKTTAKDEIIKDAKEQLEEILSNTIQRLEETVNNCEQQLEDKANNLEQQLDEHVENKIAEGIPPEIFIAKYNVTTFEEIQTAFASGKQVYVEVDGGIAGSNTSVYIAPLTCILPTLSASFTTIYRAPTGVCFILSAYVNGVSVWTVEYNEINLVQ